MVTRESLAGCPGDRVSSAGAVLPGKGLALHDGKNTENPCRPRLIPLGLEGVILQFLSRFFQILMGSGKALRRVGSESLFGEILGSPPRPRR